MNKDKKKPPMPPKIRKLLAEWEELIELHEDALDAEDFKLTREISRKITAFVNLHKDELQIPEETYAEIVRMEESVEVTYQESLKAEKAAKEASRRARRAEDDYYRILLEQTPRGKGNTEH